MTLQEKSLITRSLAILLSQTNTLSQCVKLQPQVIWSRLLIAIPSWIWTAIACPISSYKKLISIQMDLKFITVKFIFKDLLKLKWQVVNQWKFRNSVYKIHKFCWQPKLISLLRLIITLLSQIIQLLWYPQAITSLEVVGPALTPKKLLEQVTALTELDLEVQMNKFH